MMPDSAPRPHEANTRQQDTTSCYREVLYEALEGICPSVTPMVDHMIDRHDATRQRLNG